MIYIISDTFFRAHVRPLAVPGGLWLVQFQPGDFLIFDNIILLCRRLCAMLFMYSLINCTVISNCVNCLCNSIQLYFLWRFINCVCLLPFLAVDLARFILLLYEQK